jgi:hypothetical protein
VLVLGYRFLFASIAVCKKNLAKRESPYRISLSGLEGFRNAFYFSLSLLQSELGRIKSEGHRRASWLSCVPNHSQISFITVGRAFTYGEESRSTSVLNSDSLTLV